LTIIEVPLGTTPTQERSIVKVLLKLLPLLCFACLVTIPVRGDDKKSDLKPAREAVPALEKSAPENIEDLKAIQGRVKEVLKKVIPATVGVQIGGASGSGVIIDKEGHVLTAGHVSGKPDQPVTLIFPDGKRVKGKSLGSNRGIDSGLLEITDKGDYPFVEMGKSSELKKGQWVISTGHPGGFRPGRTPVVRLGRILDANGSAIRTDCTLVGGDSGGPLFDMDGKVIGIHSRIAGRITDNIHVPVDTYRETWDRLVKGETWGGGLFGGFGGAPTPYLGIEIDREGENCKITKVIPKTPAAEAGLKEDDVILKFAGDKVDGPADLAPLLRKKKIGDAITVEVQRGKDTVKLTVKLGKRED
jgi:serine protease Do